MVCAFPRFAVPEPKAAAMSAPLQVYHTRNLIVTYDPGVCMNFGDCLRANREVFDRSRPEWIDLRAADPDAIAEIAARCPSGALHAIRPNRPGERPLPSAGVSVHATPNGPIVVKGKVTLELPSGGTEQRSGAFSLCRCGHTRSTPFCDGSHIRVGFKSPA